MTSANRGLVGMVGKGSDFSNLHNLSKRIGNEASIQNLNVPYEKFWLNDKQTMFAIEVHVPIPYDKFDDENYIEGFSNRRYPMLKRADTRPKGHHLQYVVSSGHFLPKSCVFLLDFQEKFMFYYPACLVKAPFFTHAKDGNHHDKGTSGSK